MTADSDKLPEITEPLLAIGQEVLDLAPPQYDLLLVRADFSVAGVADLHSEARVGSEVIPLRISFDALDRFEEMRAAFEAAGQPLWTEATVTVDPAGTPKANFTYAD